MCCVVGWLQQVQLVLALLQTAAPLCLSMHSACCIQQQGVHCHAGEQHQHCTCLRHGLAYAGECVHSSVVAC
jgi:hypothetical protein